MSACFSWLPSWWPGHAWRQMDSVLGFRVEVRAPGRELVLDGCANCGRGRIRRRA